MDPLTHGLTGAVMAQAGARQRWGRQAILAMIAGAMIPDIDVFWAEGVLALETHRGITHSLVGAVGLAAILGVVLLPLGREKRWWLLFALALVAILGGHLFMDLINNFGIQLFLPFSRARPALDLVFILDPLVTVPMLGALAGGVIWRARAVGLARASFAWLGVYLAALAMSHTLAIGHLTQAARDRGIEPLRVSALPAPLNPLRWDGFVEDRIYYWRGPVSALGGSVVLEATAKPDADRTVALAAQSREVQVYLWFARFPALNERVEDGRRILDYRDLRFAYPLRSRDTFGRLRVILSRDGVVERVLFNP
jgi:inner membrane protein